MPAAASLPESCLLLQRQEAMRDHAKIQNLPLKTTATATATHRRSRGTGRLPRSGRTAAQIHTSRRPPRSRCRLTLQRQSQQWATEQRSQFWYNCKGNWLSLVALWLARHILSQCSEIKDSPVEISTVQNKTSLWCPHTFFQCVGGSQPLSDNSDSLVRHYFRVPAQKRHIIKLNDMSHADDDKLPFHF